MLLEFRVKNFRSIRDEQVLSMVASRDTSLEDTHVARPDGIAQRALKSAAIYGPNAGGKSNLLQALEFMRTRVAGKQFFSVLFPDDEEESCPFFRLDQASKNTPGEFEVICTDKGVRYQYGFALLRTRVVEEWLLVYRADKPQEWFHRTADDKTGEDVYKFSSYFKGQKLTWQKSTRKEALFLTVAAGLNSEQLQPIYNWFSSCCTWVSQPVFYGKLNFSALKDEESKRDIMAFISSADLGITDVVLRPEIEEAPALQQGKKNGTNPREILRPMFVHRTDEGANEEFDLQEESKGTQRLFLLAFFILRILKEGGVMIIDELESSLHPMLARFIVGLFNSAENRNGAQLIFSTHEAGLLDIKETFRRDQIWFVEKDSSQATVLYPLTDFNLRKEANVESGYLTGKYGAIPFLTAFSFADSEGDNGA